MKPLHFLKVFLLEIAFAAALFFGYSMVSWNAALSLEDIEHSLASPFITAINPYPAHFIIIYGLEIVSNEPIKLTLKIDWKDLELI